MWNYYNVYIGTKDRGEEVVFTILLVEDDRKIQEVIEDYFTSKSNGEIQIYTAVDGHAGLAAVYEREFDLCMLDVMLPGTSGFEICRAIRQKSIVPIMFLTAKGQEQDILYGYQLGCDDYLVKPFSLAELYAKTNALLKRAKGMVISSDLVCGEITLNPMRFTVKVCDEAVELPPKQYAILKYLMENQDSVIGREHLLTHIWGYDYEGNERVVDNHVKKLRKGLGSAGGQIKTVITKGYKITNNRGRL